MSAACLAPAHPPGDAAARPLLSAEAARHFPGAAAARPFLSAEAARLSPSAEAARHSPSAEAARLSLSAESAPPRPVGAPRPVTLTAMRTSVARAPPPLHDGGGPSRRLEAGSAGGWGMLLEEVPQSAGRWGNELMTTDMSWCDGAG